MPENNKYTKQFIKKAQYIYELDMLQLYRNTLNSPYVIRFSKVLESISKSLGISNPFTYYISGGQVSVKIKSDITDLSPTSSMFKFDSNYNLVYNSPTTNDKFFTKVGDNIILKDI